MDAHYNQTSGENNGKSYVSPILVMLSFFSGLPCPAVLCHPWDCRDDQNPGRKKNYLYRESYALVIGNGNYRKGWDPLPGAIQDAEEVAGALGAHGFRVTLRTDLTRDAFNRIFGEFVRLQGKSGDNRLLFYYAGHGYTERMATDEELGYLVMVDAPAPEKDPVGFSLASVDMQTLVTQAKMIRSKHVLFMFDSCFSGSVLNVRDRVAPSAVSDKVRYPPVGLDGSLGQGGYEQDTTVGARIPFHDRITPQKRGPTSFHPWDMDQTRLQEFCK